MAFAPEGRVARGHHTRPGRRVCRIAGQPSRCPRGSDHTACGTGRPDPARVERARPSRSTLDRGDPCQPAAKQRRMSRCCSPVADDTMSSRAYADDPPGTPRTASSERPGSASATISARSRRENSSLLAGVLMLPRPVRGIHRLDGFLHDLAPDHQGVQRIAQTGGPPGGDAGEGCPRRTRRRTPVRSPSPLQCRRHRRQDRPRRSRIPPARQRGPCHAAQASGPSRSTSGSWIPP